MAKGSRTNALGEASSEKVEASGLTPEYVEGSSKDHVVPDLDSKNEVEEQDDSPSDGEYAISSDDSTSQGGDEAPSEANAVKPLSTVTLADFEKAQQRAGIIYISRIPPGMRPAKVKHLMSGYGKVGRVFLQQEDPKRAYLRKKHTATKKVHYTEGWVEFESKHVARSVAEMLNAQPIGGKKGTRWRDDIWTMKYLPKFKWNMLTEQVAQEAAAHTARMRVELSQSRAEQRDYLKNVELARVLDKRAKRKRSDEPDKQAPKLAEEQALTKVKKPRKQNPLMPSKQIDDGALNTVLSSIF